MRRLRDLVTIAAILAAVGFGVYELGHNVDSTSAKLAKSDSELGQRVYHPANPSGPSHHTLELVGVAVGGAVGVVILFSVGSALFRPRRPKSSWRAT
ncbi:MAG: hypothetical protein ACXVRV_11860 [Gaiellaceae bacterium]